MKAKSLLNLKFYEIGETLALRIKILRARHLHICVCVLLLIIVKLFVWKTNVRRYSRSIRGSVSVGRSTVFCLCSAILHYAHFQFENENLVFAAYVGNEGPCDHQRTEIRVSKINANKRGAKAHLKGARCGIQKILTG